MFVSNFFQTIVVFENRIDEFESDSFFGLDSLAYLHIEHTSLKVLPPLRPVKDTLTSLAMRMGDIYFIPYDYFIGFTTLHRVDLQYNKINNSKIELNFSPLNKTLKVLILSYNMLHQIPYSLYSVNYEHLKTLQLDHNGIAQLERRMLHAWPNISRLDISFNKILTFGGLFHNIPRDCSGHGAIILKICHNHLNCSFTETWGTMQDGGFDRYCLHADNNTFLVDDIQFCECVSPQNMKGDSLLSLGKSKNCL